VENQILEHDRQVLLTMAPRLDALWRPLRFLADLEKIWHDLPAEEQIEIEGSRPYRDQFHRRAAEGHVIELLRLTGDIHAAEHRELRDSLKTFLDRWEFQEPDQVKILSALVRRAAS
jgi:hypothetical protein